MARLATSILALRSVVVAGLTRPTEDAIQAVVAEHGLPESLAATLRAYAASTGAEFNSESSCPAVATNHSLDGDALRGYWNVLGTAPPAMEDLFDCPMMNITADGIVKKPGHNTEHYKAYLAGHRIEFQGDEYVPDASEPGRKLFSVFCLFGHCELYIPYYWIETDPEYGYASVFYCWPSLPWLVRGYLVTSREAVRPPADLESRFLENAKGQGLLKGKQQHIRWRDERPCWDHVDEVVV